MDLEQYGASIVLYIAYGKPTTEINVEHWPEIEIGLSVD